MDDDIEEVLLAVLARVKLPIDDACRAMLTRLIADGVPRVDAEPERTAALAYAVLQLRRLVDDMTQQSRILRFEALHPPTLRSALDRLCPLWPFC